MANKREMPWKGEKNPYRIWLSEIILQQTRVEQGKGYYERFLKKFPDIRKLAGAKDEEVFKLWEGLGYYSRCRNLLETARHIVKEKNAVFPGSYEEILCLKGVGPYTAAAIASFAFSEPRAVLDGNVIRILSRYFAISTPFNAAKGKKILAKLAYDALDKSNPGLYNQAIMDFGATVCKPVPDCPECPLKKNCLAFKQKRVHELPVKKAKPAVRNRWFYYVVGQIGGNWVYRMRPEGDIWHNLHEFILLEDGPSLSGEEVVNKLFPGLKSKSKPEVSRVYIQKLTHQTIHTVFIEVAMRGVGCPAGYRAGSSGTLRKLAFPKVIAGYIRERNLLSSILI